MNMNSRLNASFKLLRNCVTFRIPQVDTRIAIEDWEVSAARGRRKLSANDSDEEKFWLLFHANR